MLAPLYSLTTTRLLAEAISPSHFHEIHRLHTDAKVMQTLSADGKPLSKEATRESIQEAVDHWQQVGFRRLGFPEIASWTLPTNWLLRGDGELEQTVRPTPKPSAAGQRFCLSRRSEQNLTCR